MRSRASKTIYDVRLSELLGFSYGPEPRDWQFWFSERPDKFAGQFTAMVEGSGQQRHPVMQDPPLSVPGSWIESIPKDDEDMDSSSDCASDFDQDSDYGDDPDYDIERFADRETTFYIRVPTAFPLTPESNLLLFIRGGSIPF